MFINLGWLLFALIALPLLVIFFVPVCLVSLVCSDNLRYRLWQRSGSWLFVGFLVAVLAFAVGLALNIILVPLAVFIGAPCALCMICAKRRQNSQTAEENLRRI
jgi:hypothetical protein